jgi:hypothetical protein
VVNKLNIPCYSNFATPANCKESILKEIKNNYIIMCAETTRALTEIHPAIVKNLHLKSKEIDMSVAVHNTHDGCVAFVAIILDRSMCDFSSDDIVDVVAAFDSLPTTMSVNNGVINAIVINRFYNYDTAFIDFTQLPPKVMEAIELQNSFKDDFDEDCEEDIEDCEEEHIDKVILIVPLFICEEDFFDYYRGNRKEDIKFEEKLIKL